MKMIVVVALALVAAVAAVPVGTEPPKILKAEFDQQPDGSFNSDFETENGIKEQVVGELRTVIGEDKKEHLVVVLRGSYSYKNNDGNDETITYVADENGYQPQGPSIPVVPAARR